MITVLFLMYSLPFFVLLLAFCATEIYLIEGKEDPYSTTLSLLIFVALLASFTDWKPWQTSFTEIFGFGLLYFIIGSGYLFPRWVLYVKDKSKDFEGNYSDLKRQWDGDRNKWGNGWANYATFEEMLRGKYLMPPMPWDRGVKSKLYMWWVYWPLSAAWILAHRPIEWAWEWLLASIKDWLVSLSNKIFKSHFQGR
jgi:hypothetical protein